MGHGAGAAGGARRPRGHAVGAPLCTDPCYPLQPAPARASSAGHHQCDGPAGRHAVRRRAAGGSRAALRRHRCQAGRRRALRGLRQGAGGRHAPTAARNPGRPASGPARLRADRAKFRPRGRGRAACRRRAGHRRRRAAPRHDRAARQPDLPHLRQRRRHRRAVGRRCEERDRHRRRGPSPARGSARTPARRSSPAGWRS